MKRIALATFALMALAASALAQVIAPGTNAIPTGGAYNSSVPTCVSGQACWLQVDVSGNLKVVTGPSGTASTGIIAIVSTSGEATHVLKAAPGNLYSAYATNLTATAGFLAIVNLTAAPADGAITPLECVPLPANGNASIDYGGGPPAVFSAGITAIVTSATTCFTKTTGVITAFIKGSVQ